MPEWVWAAVYVVGVAVVLSALWLEWKRRPNRFLSFAKDCWFVVIFMRRILEDRAAGNRVSWLDVVAIAVFGLSALGGIARFITLLFGPNDTATPNDPSAPDNPSIPNNSPKPKDIAK